mmetsp:Transcript_47734/g.144334  ORF Transcript_47734/g.144334 Transcript_47734/m.144334 type:complete len:229 (-) Transcript_47734:349-1035(-)
MPSTVKRIRPTKASCDCAPDTRSKAGFRRNFPATAIVPSAMTALTKAEVSAEARPSPPPARIGVTTNKGTTARSCRSSTPKDDLPKSVESSSLSFRSWRTNAELESASPPPSTTIAAADCPQREATAATARAVKTNWLSPSPKTSLLIDMRVSKLRWIPISNKKNTTPRSARVSVVCTSAIRFFPLGPSSTPLAKNPRIGDIPTSLHRPGIKAEVARRNRVSALVPFI